MNNEQSIGLEVKIISNLIKRRLCAAMPSFHVENLTEMQAQIIDFLHQNSDNRDIFQKDIEEYFSIRRSTASRILRALEIKHFITRESVIQDARLKKLCLTPISADSHVEMKTKIEELEILMCKGLTQEEIDAFFATTKKIIENLK